MATNADSTVTPPGANPPRAAGFPTTQWSVVLRAGGADEAQVRPALETLCRAYWYPVYGFVRRQGRSHAEAEDLTQGFFAQLLAAEGLPRAVRERGRFRSFLLAALRHFLTDEWRRQSAQRRGGGEAPLPLELPGAGERFAAEPADPALTPEEAFDRHWALDLIDRTVDDLRTEYAGSGRAALFATLVPHVWGDEPGSQAEAARSLGMNEHAFTVAIHRLRKRLRDRLREQVAATVAHDTETDDELRLLLAAVRGRKGAG